MANPDRGILLYLFCGQIKNLTDLKYFIIAGELSGDKHGARLCKSLKEIDNKAKFAFWGGDEMAQETSQKPLKHISELAFMGFVQVFKNIGTIRKNFALIKKQILEFEPDCIVYIDYPGFNLRLVQWAFEKGFRNYYYISPTVWAWKAGRKELIRKYVAKLFVILPFEKDWYRSHGIDVTYAGNPSLEQVRSFTPDPSFSNRYPHGAIALLPGSRKQEIELILPIMLEVCCSIYSEIPYLIAKPPHLPATLYEKILSNYPLAKVELIENKFYDVLHVSKAALTASGTATLETAFFKVPQVVCYKASPLNYRIAKFFVDLKFISLVNLIMGKEVIPELIQNDFTTEKTIKAFEQITANKGGLISDYEQLIKLVDTGFPVSATIASQIFSDF